MRTHMFCALIILTGLFSISACIFRELPRSNPNDPKGEAYHRQLETNASVSSSSSSDNTSASESTSSSSSVASSSSGVGSSSFSSSSSASSSTDSSSSQGDVVTQVIFDGSVPNGLTHNWGMWNDSGNNPSAYSATGGNPGACWHWPFSINGWWADLEINFTLPVPVDTLSGLRFDCLVTIPTETQENHFSLVLSDGTTYGKSNVVIIDGTWQTLDILLTNLHVPVPAGTYEFFGEPYAPNAADEIAGFAFGFEGTSSSNRGDFYIDNILKY